MIQVLDSTYDDHGVKSFIDMMSYKRSYRCIPDKDVRSYVKDRKRGKLVDIDFDNLTIKFTTSLEASYTEMPKDYHDWAIDNITNNIMKDLKDRDFTEDDPKVKFLIDLLSIDGYCVMGEYPKRPKKCGRIDLFEIVMISMMKYDFDGCLDVYALYMMSHNKSSNPVIVNIDYPDSKSDMVNEIESYKQRNEKSQLNCYSKYRDDGVTLIFVNESEATFFMMSCELSATITHTSIDEWWIKLAKILKDKDVLRSDTLVDFQRYRDETMSMWSPSYHW